MRPLSRLREWWWRAFLSDWTTRRQDRAFRQFQRALRSPVADQARGKLEQAVAEGLGVVRLPFSREWPDEDLSGHYVLETIDPPPITKPVPLSLGRCPNDPPCGHPAMHHDVEDQSEDPRPMCCADGCPCGKAVL